MSANYTLAKQIASAAEDEWEAIEGYIDLLALEGLSQEDIEQIEEIIGDEKQHAEVLAKMIAKYDGNIPVAED